MTHRKKAIFLIRPDQLNFLFFEHLGHKLKIGGEEKLKHPKILCLSHNMLINSILGTCATVIEAFINDPNYIRHMHVKLFIPCHIIFDNTI